MIIKNKLLEIIRTISTEITKKSNKELEQKADEIIKDIRRL